MDGIEETHEDVQYQKAFGNFAENLAADYLLTKGYTIRERNWRMGHLEIDIIAQIGTIVAFIEVKARKGNYSDPLDAVDDKKMRRILKAADVYMRNLPYEMDARMDIITVIGNMSEYVLEHIEDAFIPPLQSFR